MHVLAPAAELAAKPLPGGVAVMNLAEALAAGGWLPGGGSGVSGCVWGGVWVCVWGCLDGGGVHCECLF